ncbi:methionyl-tRNA formyltransferase, partial [Campylobacter fetus subsp. venerealis]
MKKDLRIIYMGTPEFAVPALELLVKNDWNIVGVITAPDKPKGRGQKLVPSPVKEAALRLG